jgi:hypothetical protein
MAEDEVTYRLVGIDRYGQQATGNRGTWFAHADVVGAEGIREGAEDLLSLEAVHRVEVYLGTAHVETITRQDIGMVLG